MESLQIKIPEGFEVNNFNKETGEITFKEKPKNVVDRIKTIEDILNNNNTSIEEIDEMFEDAPEHLKYQYITELLCISLNEGWIPNWDDSSEGKYFPWFKMSSSGFRYDVYGWFTASAVGSRLCFKSIELAKYAGEQFTDLYKQFMITK